MAAADPHAIEKARRAAARSLPAECVDDFLRLSRSLVYGPAFQWLLVETPDEGLRRQVIAELETVLRAARLRSATLPLSRKIPDVADLEGRLMRHARQSAVVHVLGAPGWFDAARWDAFNVRRERIATNAKARLVFWLDAEAIEAASRGAPDLWSWRAGVYQFARPPAEFAGTGTSARPPVELSARPTGPDDRSLDEKLRRIGEIRAWLAASPPEELRGGPLDELGRLLFMIGDYDEALRIWREEELPVYEKLGDVRARAVTMGKIADVLQARGDLDEALRIRREEELPVYEMLGDVRSLLVGRANLAVGLHMRGRSEDHPEISRLLVEAFNAARRVRLPEASQIAGIYQQVFRAELPGSRER